MHIVLINNVSRDLVISNLILAKIKINVQYVDA